MSQGPIERLAALAVELRERRINHGRSTSPTLEAWAARLQAELPELRTLVEAALAITDPRVPDRWGYRAAHHAMNDEKREALRLALLPFLPEESNDEPLR